MVKEPEGRARAGQQVKTTDPVVRKPRKDEKVVYGGGTKNVYDEIATIVLRHDFYQSTLPP